MADNSNTDRSMDDITETVEIELPSTLADKLDMWDDHKFLIERAIALEEWLESIGEPVTPYCPECIVETAYTVDNKHWCPECETDYAEGEALTPSEALTILSWEVDADE